jgi:HJR/Mrr/RecB family endonuclease
MEEISAAPSILWADRATQLGKGAMQIIDSGQALAGIISLLFNMPIGWLLLLAMAASIAVDRLAPPRRRRTSRKRRPPKPLYKEMLEPLLGGTGIWILLAWGQLASPQVATPIQAIESAVAGQSLLSVILACSWIVVGASWYLPRRGNRGLARLRLTLEQMAAMPDDAFEELVAQLFIARGNRAQVIGGSGDHGVDIVVTAHDGARALVQCKRFGRGRWVGEPQVRDLYGAFMHDGQANKAYLITTGFFSDAAKAWSKGKPIILMDGDRLSRAVRSPAIEG